jgi:hypothetical protein
MLYGDVFVFQPDGIKTDPNALQPVGIFDQSLCWAVWLHDASPENVDPSPHLVISPVHPRFWPFLLRFEIKLEERAGAMAEAAEFLAKADLNIQFGESSPSGHHHATWNVVCEAVNVRRAFEERIRRFQLEKRSPVTSRDELNQLANELADAMYRTAVKVKDGMLSKPTFLHRRFIDPKFFLLHEPGAIANRKVRSAALADFPHAVRVKWIQNLPVFAFYGSNAAAEPHALKYDAEASMLRCDESGVTFGRILQEGGVMSPPTKAIASIYPEEHHIRVIPIRSPQEMNGLLQIDVRYDSRFPNHLPPTARASDDSTIGVWAGVCNHVRACGIDLRRVTNTTTIRAAHKEGGVLSLIGVAERALRIPELQELSRKIEGLSEAAGSQSAREMAVRPTISPLAIQRVFISWRSKTEHADLLDYAVASARNWGFDPIFVKNPVGENLTATVDAMISQCAGFFQILSLGDAEKTQIEKQPDSGAPDLSWMWYEHGVARGRDIPIIRMVDISKLTFDGWRTYLKQGSDHLGEFRSDGADRIVVQQIDRSMQQLAELVRKYARKNL